MPSFFPHFHYQFVVGGKRPPWWSGLIFFNCEITTSLTGGLWYMFKNPFEWTWSQMGCNVLQIRNSLLLILLSFCQAQASSTANKRTSPRKPKCVGVYIPFLSHFYPQTRKLWNWACPAHLGTQEFAAEAGPACPAVNARKWTCDGRCAI